MDLRATSPRQAKIETRRPLATALAILAAFASGCAGGSDELEKQIAAMHSELTGLRAENAALGERVDALEIANGGLKGYKDKGPAAVTPPPSDKPDLAVVRLAPGDPKDAPTTDDNGPRVVLRSTSKGVVQEDAKDDSTAGGPSADFAKAKELYEKKSYSDALTAFSSFLVRYPDNSKAADATFYRGECYFAKGDYKNAVSDIEAALKVSPASDRAADGLFDLAKAYDKLGDKDSAEKARKKLKNDFPKSSAAKKLN